MKFPACLIGSLSGGFLLLGSTLHAEDLYVRPGHASGAHTGADWTNAWNAFPGVQWGIGPGLVGPGDTLWIAGGNYGSTLLIGASGAAGSPIVLKRVRSSDAVPAAAAGWNSALDSQVTIATAGSGVVFTGGIGSHVILDGQVPSGIRVNYGDGGRGVVFDGERDFTDITLRYLEVAGPGPIVQSGDTRGFDLTTQANLTNITITRSEAHHSDTLMQVSRTTNLVVEYSDFHHAGAVNAATYHPNTIYLATVTNATIRYNRLREIDVEGLFFGDPGNNGAQIYGNLFYQGSSVPNSGRGIEFDRAADSKNFLVYNNTFVGLPLPGVNFNNGQPHPGAVVQNNLFDNSAPQFGPAAHDYNWVSSGSYGEVHGVTGSGSPFRNAAAYDYRIVGSIGAGLPANKGINLGPPYHVDHDGNLRGADGFWDIGAYESNNRPPTVSAIGGQTTQGGIATGPISFTVADAETPALSLVVTAASGNPTLLPNTNVVFGGSGANRTLTLTPAPGRTGTATVTVTVSDGKDATVTSFVLTVTPPPNAAPTISRFSDQATGPGRTVGPLPFILADAETPTAGLVVTAASGNPALLPPANIVLGGSGPNRTLTLTPAPGRTGTAIVTLTVSDGVDSASSSFTLTVAVPANVAPTIGPIPDQAANSGATIGPLAFTVGDTETPAQDLMVRGSSDNSALLPDAGIVFGGSGAHRTLTLAPAAGRTGTATVTVTVGDDVDSASTSFTLTVRTPAVIPPPNTPPTISRVSAQVTGPGVAVGPIAFVVTDAETPAASLVVTTSSDSPSLLPNAGIVGGGSGANRTLTLTPVSGRTGTATVSVTVSDGVDSAGMDFLLVVAAPTDPPRIAGHLRALSVRGFTGSGEATLIAGLVVAGMGLKPLVVRAVGPALGPQGVANALPDPLLRLFDGNGRLLQSNDDWGDTPGIANAFAAVGLSPLPAGSKDAALVLPLEPGNYTAHGISSDGGAGIVLIEVYDAGSVTDPSRLTALSVRGQVGRGEGVLIVGLVVGGDTAVPLAIRGLGPALARSNVSGFLSDPQLALYDHAGRLLQANDNWETGPATEAVFTSVGLGTLPAGSRDAALLPTLEPGIYTVQLSGADGTSGVGLIEVYATAASFLAAP